MRLRPWQRRALDAFHRHPRKDFLAVATPGAGKTTFALTAAVSDLAHHPHRRVAVVAPTSHLKVQWADAAARFGLHLDPDWSAGGGRTPSDVHGVVVTYQQVAANPRAVRPLAADAFVILDEIHHAGSERAWGDAIAAAFEDAARRLALSGTPFRSDQDPIPFVTYDLDEAVADHVYGYGDALHDGGVVRPVFFPRFNGQMEWTAPDGALLRATFDDRLDRTLASQRLRTALSPDGQWLPTVLREAHTALDDLRRQHPDAGGLVITMDVDHARAVTDLLARECGTTPVVATSDDPDASDRIAAFAAGTDPWIVAVRMVSEGVDIPRLRVGVYATNTATELFFRQAVGRLVRWTPGLRRQKAFMFIPDDERLRTFAARIGDERTHSLRRREQDGEQDPVALDAQQAAPGDQLSLFQALSAVATDAAIDGAEDPGSVFADAHPEDLIHDDEDGDDPSLMLEFAPPPLPGGATVVVDRPRRRRELRQANADRVQMLSHLTGAGHQEINARLNDVAGIRRVDEATLDQLERRLREADRWIASV